MTVYPIRQSSNGGHVTVGLRVGAADGNGLGVSVGEGNSVADGVVVGIRCVSVMVEEAIVVVGWSVTEEGILHPEEMTIFSNMKIRKNRVTTEWNVVFMFTLINISSPSYSSDIYDGSFHIICIPQYMLES